MYIAICDDDKDYILHITQQLAKYRIEKLSDIRWASFQTGLSLLSAIEDGEIFDAVVLDIYMNEINGLDVAKKIRDMNKSIDIIFLTSSPLFAVDSYSVDAIDYIIKPIKEEKLHQVLDKLISQKETISDQGIPVKDSEGGITKVIWNQLMYMEAMGHYTLLYHRNGTTTRTSTSFTSLLKQASSQNCFVQTHRSYAVNLHYVHRIAKNEIVMLCGSKLPLPKSRYQNISERFHDVIFGGEAKCLY
ncbi:MAG: LytTR family DNA-binding domain-containing protein [Eubacteriales bacterium]|nr:LytTR family DNA-binding domain-containing protein [Eubacteriales bacterium]